MFMDWKTLIVCLSILLEYIYRFQHADVILIKMRRYFIVEVDKLIQVNSKSYINI